MRNYRLSGDIVKTTAPADIESGSFVQIGELKGFAVDTVKAGDVLVIMTKGVFDIVMTSGTPVFGDKIYVTSAGAFTTTADSNEEVGLCVGPGDFGVHVRIV